MIKLKSPLNYKGTIIDTGAIVGFLPPEMQEKLIENGVAESVNPEEEKPQDPYVNKTAAELITIIEAAESGEVLKAILKSETAGKNRKTVLEAIEEKAKVLAKSDDE